MKILIVDDEILVRLALKSAINWEEKGFELVGEAADGIEALKIIEEYVPDIVLTDIAMPNMDGLELIKTVKNKYPQIKFLILSCYNDFEYVKEAMKLGAHDYILKLSMQPSDLIKSVCELREKIETEKKKTEEINKLKMQINLNIRVIRNKFLEDILKDNIKDVNEFNQKIKALNLKMTNEYFIVAIFHIDNELYKNTSEGIKSYDIHVVNILEEITSNYNMGNVFKTRSGGSAVIFSFKQEIKARSIYDKIMFITKEAAVLIKNMLNITVSTGISGIVKNYINIKYAYEQASVAVGYKFYKGKMSVGIFGEFDWNDENLIVKNKYYKELINAIKALDFKSIKKNIDVIFTTLKENKNIKPIFVRKMSRELIFYFKEAAKKYELNIDLLLGVKDIFSEINELETIEQLEKFLLNIYNKLLLQINGMRGKGCRYEVNKIKDYISANYFKNLTVAYMSKAVNMNPDYLSHLFKKEVGTSFVDYVNSIRIRKAKEYMKSSNMKIYEISYKVGYNNVNYFSKLFKKKVGMSPIRYIKNLKNSKKSIT